MFLEKVFLTISQYSQETPVLESPFNKEIGAFQHRYFPVNIAKFIRTLILKNICEKLLLQLEPSVITFSVWKSFEIQIFNEVIKSLIGNSPVSLNFPASNSLTIHFPA